MYNLSLSMPKLTENLFLEINKFQEIENWTLVGGTALSIYLQHRTSEDLDFFINHHILDKAAIKQIDSLLNKLSDNGWNSSLSLQEDNQIDYNINGVKVTFHSTTAINIVDIETNSYNQGCIKIASINTIAAMKMYTVLKYRIKSRDFYDIYTLITKESYTFYDLIALMQENYPTANFEEKYIENRFLKAKLSTDDEGLETLELSEVQDFNSLRNFFRRLFISQILKEKEAVEEIMKDLFKMQESRFGLDNSTLCIKLAKESSLINLETVISSGYNIEGLNINLSGKTLFNYLMDNTELLEKALHLIDSIPKGLSKEAEHAGKVDVVKIIEDEKLVNRQLKNINSPEKIAAFAMSKGLDTNLFIRKVRTKTKVLNELISIGQ